MVQTAPPRGDALPIVAMNLARVTACEAREQVRLFGEVKLTGKHITNRHPNILD